MVRSREGAKCKAAQRTSQGPTPRRAENICVSFKGACNELEPDQECANRRGPRAGVHIALCRVPCSWRRWRRIVRIADEGNMRLRLPDELSLCVYRWERPGSGMGYGCARNDRLPDEHHFDEHHPGGSEASRAAIPVELQRALH